jgi:hypothetical protein
MVYEPVMQIAIPFLFVFAIVFGVLELALKGWSKSVKAVIALALALFSVGYSPFTAFLWSQMGNIVVFFMIMFLIAFLTEMVGWKKIDNPAEKMVTTTVVLLILLSIGWMVMDTISFNIPFIGGPSDLMLLIGIIIIIAMFSAAFKTGGAYITTVAEMQKKKEKGG